MTKTPFDEAKAEHMERLEQFTPIVERVHGENHPEFFEVRKIFDQLNEKVKTNRELGLDKEFSELRKITNNYKVPNDVCESYEAVYNMLEELNQAYLANKK